MHSAAHFNGIVSLAECVCITRPCYTFLLPLPKISTHISRSRRIYRYVSIAYMRDRAEASRCRWFFFYRRFFFFLIFVFIKFSVCKDFGSKSWFVFFCLPLNSLMCVCTVPSGSVLLLLLYLRLRLRVSSSYLFCSSDLFHIIFCIYWRLMLDLICIKYVCEQAKRDRICAFALSINGLHLNAWYWPARNSCAHKYSELPIQIHLPGFFFHFNQPFSNVRALQRRAIQPKFTSIAFIFCTKNYFRFKRSVE